MADRKRHLNYISKSVNRQRFHQQALSSILTAIFMAAIINCKGDAQIITKKSILDGILSLPFQLWYHTDQSTYLQLYDLNFSIVLIFFVSKNKIMFIQNDIYAVTP